MLNTKSKSEGELINQLTNARPAPKVWHQGKLVLPSKIKKNTAPTPDLTGLSEHEKIQALTNARKGKASTYQPAPTGPSGELLWVDGVCMGFIAYE